MIRSATLLCVLALSVHGSPINVNPRLILDGGELRIVGGRPIAISEAPYQVSFQRLKKHVCGGSIISEYHVLTGAQCSILESNVQNLAVGSGSEKLASLQIHRIVRNVRNKAYNADTVDFDVAVLKVETPFTFNANTKPIAIANIGEEPADNESVMITGWGSATMDGPIFENLMAVDVNIANRKACSIAYAGLGADITARMICAGVPSGGKDSCRGDSGGALVSKTSGKQVGIVSWGYMCAQPHFPGVYTNMADKDIHDFVTSEMKN